MKKSCLSIGIAEYFRMTLILFAAGCVLCLGFTAEADQAEVNRGVALLLKGEQTLDWNALSEAEAIFLRECQGGSRDPKCEYYLARVYLAEYSYWSEVKKDPDQASAALAKAETSGKAAVTRRPNAAEAHVLLGRIYQVKLSLSPITGLTMTALGDSPVVTEFNRALELDPNNGEAELGLGIYYQFIPRILGGDGYRARTHFKRAARLMPNNPEPLVWMSISLRQEGQLQEARQFLNRAQALEPNNRFVKAESARLAAAEKQAGGGH